MKKTTASKTASVSHVLLGQSASITDPLPTESAPSPPAEYVPTKIGRGFRPQHAQISIAVKAAGELRGNTSYAEQFGSAAPDAASVADALTNASAWSSKLQNASTWYQYVKQQEGLAWKHALGLTDPLRVPFEFGVARNATLGQELPSVAKFFAAAKDSAKKAVATRKRKAAAKKGGSEPVSPTLASASPAPADVAEVSPTQVAKSLN